MDRIDRISVTRPLIQLGLALVLGGCAIGDTVRGVHLKQQTVLHALTEAIFSVETDAPETDAPEAAESLYASEAGLNAACRPLQQLAFRKLHGDKVGFGLKFNAVYALGECDRKAGEVADFLMRTHPEAAGPYLSEVDAPSR